MLYLVSMVAGTVIGLAVGRDGDALWGLLLGFTLAHVIRLSRRVARLERRLDKKVETSTGAAPARPVSGSTVSSPAVPTEGGLPPSPEPPRPARPAAPRPQEAPVAEPQPIAPRSAQPEPAKPGWVQRGIGAVARFFTTGNPLVRVGALVLFVGVAFLLKYLADRVTVPIEMRLAGIAAGGLAMVASGLVLRRRRPGFALPFQGAGIGVLYLTTYAAVRLYPVLPPSVALAILLAVVGLTIVLALVQDAAPLATFGVIGGFLAPVLASTGQGSHVELFSFYLLLNVVVGVIAWFRAWRWLNWLGFVFTFGIASLWGAQYYRPQHFASVEPFLLVHVALYLAISVLFAVRQPPRLKGLVDGTLVFGTPLVGFTLQALLLEGDTVALAVSSAVFGVVYLVLRQLLLRWDRAHFRLLAQCFLALGAGFLTLAMPLAFDARVTSAMWTLEGTAVAWVGIRQSSRARSWAGYGLMALGSVAYLLENDFGRAAGVIFLNADFIGVAIVALGFLYIAHHVQRDPAAPQFPHLASLMWVYGSLWWWLGGLVELERWLTGAPRLLTAMLLLGVSALAMVEYGRRHALAMARVVAVIGALALPLAALVWRAPEIGPLMLNANTLAAAMVTGVLTACGLRLAPGGRLAGWPTVLGAVGVGTWLFSGLSEIDARLAGAAQLHGGLIFVSLSLLVAARASGPLRWPQWRRWVEVLSIVPALCLASAVERSIQPFAGTGLVAWPLAFAASYFLLRWREASDPGRLDTLHALAFWSLIAVATHAVQLWVWTLPGVGSAWRVAGLGGVPLLLACLVRLPPLAHTWPVGRYPESYRGWWLAPVVLWLAGWLLVSNVLPPGEFAPTRFFPLVNVQDAVCVGSLWLIIHWCRQAWETHEALNARAIAVLLGLLVFLVLNAAMLRALHFYLPIEWDLERMLNSFTVQASLTLLWASTAMAAMVAGSQTLRRWLWMAGAVLMACAVVKLFLVDTAASGTLARIAAFFGVALGLFVAGYFAPRPPAVEEA